MVCSRYPKEYRYYETVLKRKCFRKLHNNVWEKKTKWILLEKAEFHYRFKLLNKHFNSWILYLNERYKKKINRRAAEAFHEEKLKWRGLSALKRNVELTSILMRIYKKKFEWNLKYRCWHQWKHYTQKRAKVREIKLLADRIREERLRIRCLCLWSFRFKEKLSLRNAHKTAVARHEMKLKDKYFNLWRIFCEKRSWEMKIQKLAATCYEDKLKEKFITSWRRYTIQRKRYRYQMKVIHNFYEGYLLKNYLNRWLAAYGKLKLDRKIQNHKLAVSFHNRKLLRKCFRCLWNVRERKRAIEEKMEKFGEIHRKIYLSFYLNFWLEKRSRKVVSDHLENKAKLWREDYLRELFLTELLKSYRERLEEKEEMANVVKYCNAVIVHRAFRGWIGETERKVNKRIQLENAIRFYLDGLMRKMFEKWKEFRMKKWRKKSAISHYQNTLLWRAMDEWKVFLIEQRTKLIEAKNMEKRINTKLLRNAFDCWRDEVVNFNSKMMTAVEFYEKSKLTRTFFVWKKNTRARAIYKTRYNRNKATLDGIIIKDVLFLWYEMHSIKLNVERKLDGFRKKREKRLISFHFGIWYKFVQKMKSIRRNARTYPEIRSSLLAEEYLVFMWEALKDKKILKRKSELARRAEEKMLKRKYLRKWLSFICWRREKILRSKLEERKSEVKNTFEFFIPVGKSTRRQPIIPEFLKTNLSLDSFEDCLNQETYRVLHPVHKKPPIVGHINGSVSSDS